MRKVTFPNLTVVLVEPVYKGNVGAVTRVMNNFGLDQLRIVGKIPTEEDFYVAVHSTEILKNAKLFPTLEEAIQGFDRVVALSRRKGRRKKVDFQPRGLAGYIARQPGTYALVFGRETYGLTDEEANLCHHRCYIPASPHFPSLNLAQAVAVVLYEIFVAERVPEPEKAHAVAAEEVDATLDFCDEVLDGLDYSRIGDKAKFRRLMNRLVLKAECTNPELREIRQIFNRMLILSGKPGLKLPE